MNYEPSSHDRLIDDVLGGEDADQFRTASLDLALAQVRCRRQRRKLVRALAVVTLGMFLVGGTLTLTPGRPVAPAPPPPLPAREGGMVRPAHEDSPAFPRSVGGVEVVSDQELLALFPNRPVALVGQPGSQRLVFLDVAQTRPGRRSMGR